VRLADGSLVTLAPNSTLSVNGRTIELSGEAVFTVTQHAEAPFTVQASGTETRVLGTTFGVRAYASDTAVRVAVAEGKVQLRDTDNGASVVLGMGDIAESGRGITPMLARGKDALSLLAWTRGRLIFKSVPLRVAAKDIERWYGLAIEFEDKSIASESITAEFDNLSAETVIGSLAKVLNAHYERRGTAVIFTRRRPSSHLPE
jgi:ferric-dicitrate binding protein FerR (iron transport regulator)